jgi:hypothetical protein
VFRTKVEVTSRLNSPIEFKKATVSCNCTNVLIPQVEIAPKEKANMTFELSIAKNEAFPTKDFDINIATSGAADRILLKLKSRISGVVAFSVKEVFLAQYDTDTKDKLIIEKSIPLRVSKIGGLQGAKVVFSKELDGRGLSGKIVVRGLDAVLELRIPTNEVLDGYVIISGDEFEPKSLPITVRGNAPVTLSPKQIVFASKDLRTDFGTAVLRFERKLATKLDEDKIEPKITAQLKDGRQVQSALSRLSSGIYRVQFEMPKAPPSTAENLSSRSDEMEVFFERPPNIGIERIKVVLP